MPHFQAELPRRACALSVHSRSGASAFFHLLGAGGGHREMRKTDAVTRALRRREKWMKSGKSSKSSPLAARTIEGALKTFG
jgi:hypothetical protein